MAMEKKGVGHRWAGLLFVNHRDDDLPVSPCETHLYNLEGDKIDVIKWSSKVYATQSLTAAENDFRRLGDKLTPEIVVKILHLYEG